MAKQFGGFTEEQKEVLARRMGFKGPMDQFGTFLQSSPAHQQKFLSYEQKAKQMVEGGSAPMQKPAASFAEGGSISSNSFVRMNPQIFGTRSSTGTNTSRTSSSKTTTPAAPTTPEGLGATREILKDPEEFTPQVEVEEMQTSPDQFINQGVGQVPTGQDVTATTTAPTATAQEVAATPARTVETATSEAPVASATQQMQAAQGTVSQQAQVTAATALPSADATVQGQLAKLMQQFDGQEPPPWAAGALRNANAIMAQRGLGSSSMAASAATQAAMESALEIAVRDAATFSQFEMQNLNNRQQARLFNAQAFLQMDMANFDAEQQMTMFKSQSIIQSLFTDQAAENASRQFNASSEAQTEQFFAQLKTQVQQFNAAQTNAMEQFRAGQADSIGMFNRQMNDAAEQFNASNRLIIDQSNAEWRRAVTTANNATINEANRTNAMNASGMTMAAYNNLMQRERDMYTFAFTSAENSANRSTELAIARLSADTSLANQAAAARADSRSSMWQAIGGLVGAIFS
jgi:hypothetical protein